MKKKLQIILMVLGVIMLGIQFIPTTRDNPPVTGEVDAPAEVKVILMNSCYDCHSNETTWPWYSHVAPVSWLVSRDVRKGRRNVNFSTWQSLNQKDRIKILGEIREEVEEGGMPLPIYTLMHSGATLSDEQKALIILWTRAAENTAVQ